MVYAQVQFFGNLANCPSGRNHRENLEFRGRKEFRGGTPGVSAQFEGELFGQRGLRIGLRLLRPATGVRLALRCKLTKPV